MPSYANVVDWLGSDFSERMRRTLDATAASIPPTSASSPPSSPAPTPRHHHHQQQQRKSNVGLSTEQ